MYVGYVRINDCIENVNILNFRVKDFNCGMESFLIDWGFLIYVYLCVEVCRLCDIDFCCLLCLLYLV